MAEDGVEEVITEQLALFDSVKKALRNFKKDSTTRKTEAYHNVRLDSLASLRVEFRENHRVLIRQSQDKVVQEKYIDTEICDQFEERYVEVVSAIRDSLAIKTTAQSNPGTSEGDNGHHRSPPFTQNLATQGVPLPEVKLPTFGGSHIDWPGFKEIFLDRIHKNENLSPLQKFHYLKTALVDDALQDIQHIGLVGDNYKEAWDMLCKQYDNHRILFTHYMDVLDQQPDVIRDDPTSLKRFIQTCRSCFSSIKNLNVDIDSQNQLLAYFLIKKLPNSIRTEWDHSLRKQVTIPTFFELLSLLDEQYLMMVTSTKQKTVAQRRSAGTSVSSFGKRDFKSMHTAKKTITCPICEKADHPVRECSKFIEMSFKEKRAAVESFKLCFNCLGYNHRSSKCSSRRSCGTCGGKHHTLIHGERESTVPTLTSATHVATGHKSTTKVGNRDQGDTLNPNLSYDVLLPTAVVTIMSITGLLYHFRALLDQCSQASFVTGRVVQLLGLHRDRVCINVNGVSGSKIITGRFSVKLSIGSRLDPLINYQVVAYVLPNVAGILPEREINTTGCDHLQNLDFADPRFFEPQAIDILLGSDVYDDCILDDTRKSRSGLPIAQKTTFGYIVSGKNMGQSVSSSILSSLHTKFEIDHLLRKFWEIEELSEPLNQPEEDQWCERFYNETHQRLENGKYLVRLPLKSEIDCNECIGRSKAMALKRFENLERRLGRDKALKAVYVESINEYLKLGQMKPVATSENQHCLLGNNQKPRYSCCYLPHHPVIKESSTSTKVRIVFDASMKTSNGKSLNDILAIGPALQSDLSAILTNWRMLKYVFMADIEKMFRRIEMHEDDAQYQRIVWREDPSHPIQEYYCTTVMFGTAPAPYLAIRTMQQLARDEGSRYPMAAEIVEQQMYVDDILSGADSLEVALQKRDQVIGMLHSASFELRKWASNHHLILDQIPPEHRYTHGMLEFKSADSIKALGLYWDPYTDEFKFQINFEIALETPNKRSILSTVARLFDPLGWLNPVVISAKIILQRLWSSKTGWDTQINEEIKKSWRQFGNELPAITQLRIPRWLGSKSDAGSHELHLFCDASQHAHSAVAYLRIRKEDGLFAINLLLAKCKVNPIKPKLTIPRAELCGATLAVKLLKFVKRNFCMDVPSCNTFLWTDSSIVLFWIQGDSSRWKQFVSHRVQKIKDESTAEQWRHIASENNPADISSRGISPSRLADCDLWWHGPPFLQLPFNDWPKSTLNMPGSFVNEEEKRVKSFLNSTTKSELNDLLKWSSFTKTVRIMALCLCFSRNCFPKLGLPTSGRLSADLLKEATVYVIRLVQKEAFPSEWNSLSSDQPLPEKSVLRPLNPFFDKENKVIRLGGRLKHALLSVDQRHPLILPTKHHITNLVVEYSHRSTLHGGVTLTLNHIRRQFWILNGRNTVRSVIHRCITCYKNQPKPCTQMMGALPAQRIQPARPFSSTGVDYAGPFNILPSKGRGRTSLKGYIALFICLSTKAIHLELVGDLSANAFIGALNRFIARRGLCADIYSDCGTNFIGANRKLKEDKIAYQRFIEKIHPQLAQQYIRWHFIPPSSPHFGGLWEAGVKSTKYHLKRTIGDQKLTYEELNTVLTQIESCLNSRPLCPLTNDPDDLMVLTPGHFLIGDSLLALPRIETTNQISLTSRWHHCQTLVQQFWRQWSSEYLSRLQRRPKWLDQKPNLKINDIVMIKDERFPCNHWPLGRIVELHPGTDNLVRVVTLKTKNGIIKRPIAKLCPLPVQDNYQDSPKDQTQ